MSIRSAIERAKALGKLIPFRQPLEWTDAPRAFLMTEHLHGQMAKARASADLPRIERWERLRAHISHFVGSGLVTWDFMRWLDPHKFEH